MSIKFSVIESIRVLFEPSERVCLVKLMYNTIKHILNNT